MDRPDDLSGEWEELVARSHARGPAATPAWLSTWWRVFGGGGRRLHALTVRDDRRLVGLAFLVGRSTRLLHTIPVRRLELLGSGETEEDEICSEYLGVVSERGYEERVASALATTIAAELPGTDEILLPAMDATDPMVGALETALSRRGYEVTRAQQVAPYIELPGSFDAYLAALPSSHRYALRRSLRDFERWAGSTSRVHWATNEPELAEGFAILQRLHRERWGSPGVFGSARFRTFHRAVLPELMRRGELRLGWLEAHGRPLAAVYNVVTQRGVSFYQSGRTLDLPHGLRVGVVLHAHAIRRSIDEGLAEYDFLAGDSRYKLELSTNTRPVVALRAARPSLREHAYHFALRARRLAVRARNVVRARLAE